MHERRISAERSGRGGPVPRGRPGGEPAGAYILCDPGRGAHHPGGATIPMTTLMNETFPGKRWPPRRISISPPWRATRLWRCNGPLPSGSRIASGSACDPGELYARLGWAALEDILDHLETLLGTETQWRLLGGEPKVHPTLGPAPGGDPSGGPWGPDC